MSSIPADSTIPPQSVSTDREIPKDSRFIPQNDIELEIKAPPILEEIAKKFTTELTIPAAPTPNVEGSFFPKLDIATRIEVDNGNSFEIDVQPDMRYIVHYLMYNTAQQYPSYDIKEHPFTSLPTLVAYKLALIIGHFLLCDIYTKSNSSPSSDPYRNDETFETFLVLLQSCHVPPDVQTLLEHLSPVRDTQRPRLTFIPNFGAFSFDHDFGFSIPISVFIKIHQIIATTRTNSDPNFVLMQIYNTPIITVNTKLYTIGNLFGGPYTHDSHSLEHQNWLKLALEAFINPVVSRSLVQRPTLSRIATTNMRVNSSSEINGYHYLLGNPEPNTTQISAMLKNIDDFMLKEFSSLPCLGSFLADASGISIITHSIETYLLPTWHALPMIQTTDEKAPSLEQIDDSAYAKQINFYVDKPTYTGQIALPTKPYTLGLLLATDTEYQPNKDPVKTKQFHSVRDIRPSVLWFQPYDRKIQSIEMAIPLGLRILNDELDSVTLPLPDIRTTLTVNNSQYRQGSIPIDYVKAYFPSTSEGNRLVSIQRKRHSRTRQLNGCACFNMSKNVLPIFAQKNTDTSTIPELSATIETGHNDFALGCTYFAWKSNSTPALPKKSLILWSSYRYTETSDETDETKIFFFATLRALYGTSVNIVRTAHPSHLIPS